MQNTYKSWYLCDVASPGTFSYLLVVEAENSLEDEDVGAVHGHRLLLAAVRQKVVDRHVHLLALLQSLLLIF